MLLIELDGVESKHAPSHVKEQIYNWLHGLQTTTATEYVFHDLRKLGNSSGTGKLSRQRRWATMVQSSTLLDHDRPSVASVPQDTLDLKGSF